MEEKLVSLISHRDAANQLQKENSAGSLEPNSYAVKKKKTHTAALPIASVALCIFRRIQAIWSLFIVLQMTHNGNLACDERMWITEGFGGRGVGSSGGINLHLISFKGDV